MKSVLLAIILMTGICFAKKISSEDFAKLTTVEINVLDILASTSKKKEVITYIGYDLISALDEILGKRKLWSEKKNLIFVCKDGYLAEIPVKIILENKAYIVYQLKNSTEFKIKNYTQGGKAVNLAPYYVVWANEEMQKSNLARFWPYQVVEILALPPNN